MHLPRSSKELKKSAANAAKEAVGVVTVVAAEAMAKCLVGVAAVTSVVNHTEAETTSTWLLLATTTVLTNSSKEKKEAITVTISPESRTTTEAEACHVDTVVDNTTIMEPNEATLSSLSPTTIESTVVAAVAENLAVDAVVENLMAVAVAVNSVAVAVVENSVEVAEEANSVVDAVAENSVEAVVVALATAKIVAMEAPTPVATTSAKDTSTRRNLDTKTVALPTTTTRRSTTPTLNLPAEECVA